MSIIWKLSLDVLSTWGGTLDLITIFVRLLVRSGNLGGFYLVFTVKQRHIMNREGLGGKVHQNLFILYSNLKHEAPRRHKVHCHQCLALNSKVQYMIVTPGYLIISLRLFHYLLQDLLIGWSENLFFSSVLFTTKKWMFRFFSWDLDLCYLNWKIEPPPQICRHFGSRWHLAYQTWYIW